MIMGNIVKDFTMIFGMLGNWRAKRQLALQEKAAKELGFDLVFAGSDLAAMKRLNHKVFGSAVGKPPKLVLADDD
jgi:hypothetical protein